MADAHKETLEVSEQHGVAERLAMLQLNRGEDSAPSGALTSTFGAHVRPADLGPSLMEQMMQDGLEYKAKKEVQVATEEKRMKKSFANGLKKGFLSGGSGRSSAGKSAAAAGASSKPTKAPADTIPTIKPASSGSSSSGSASREAGLVLPDVQEAMRSGNPLAADMRDGAWMTPDLLQRISSNPRLVAAFQNPEFCRALELMSTDPKRAMALLQHDKEAQDLFMEFGAILGPHFAKLAEEKGSEGVDSGASASARGGGIVAANDGGLSGVKGISTNSTSQGGGADLGGSGSSVNQLPPISAEEQARVDAVLRDPELRNMLMDREMQAVLQDCGRPGRLRYYMTQRPDIAAKIKRLGDAGLVQLHGL